MNNGRTIYESVAALPETLRSKVPTISEVTEVVKGARNSVTNKFPIHVTPGDVLRSAVGIFRRK
jgi:hypothetical protein